MAVNERKFFPVQKLRQNSSTATLYHNGEISGRNKMKMEAYDWLIILCKQIR